MTTDLDYSEYYPRDHYRKEAYGFPDLVCKCFAIFDELDPYAVLLHCLVGDFNMKDPDLRGDIAQCERLFAATGEPVWPALKAVVEVLLTVPEEERKGKS